MNGSLDFYSSYFNDMKENLKNLNNVTSTLEDIEGVGTKKRKNLLVYFGGLDGVKNAPVEELILVEGINDKLAEKIYSYFH